MLYDKSTKRYDKMNQEQQPKKPKKTKKAKKPISDGKTQEGDQTGEAQDKT